MMEAFCRDCAYGVRWDDARHFWHEVVSREELEKTTSTKELKMIDGTESTDSKAGLDIEGIKLVQTCGACPEQYEAFVGDRQVGYLRLRHGHFRVDCPYAGGQTVYEGSPDGDGSFTSEERERYLRIAVFTIKSWLAVEAWVAEHDKEA